VISAQPIPASAQFLGVEIGGTKLQVVAGRPEKILERRAFAIDQQAGAEGIRHQIASVLPDLIAKYRPLAVGAGFGGPVDWKNGRICCSHHISGWSDFPLGEWLATATGLPAQVDNDANVAALAEAFHGTGVGANPVFYITLGSGSGGGFVVDGRIFHGALPGEAEIGHLRLNRDGGTVETLCSGWAVDRRIRSARATHPDSILFQLIGDETRGESRHLAEALKRNDPLARDIIRETGENLALALSHVAHLIHPEVIILGGGLALVGEPLRAAVANAVPPLLVQAFQPGPRIALSALKEDSVPVGALLLAREASDNLAAKKN
jgi:glucokinase